MRSVAGLWLVAVMVTGGGCEPDPAAITADVCTSICDCLRPVGDANQNCRAGCAAAISPASDACVACVQGADICYQMIDCIDICEGGP